jgi:WD40 repeat protein
MAQTRSYGWWILIGVLGVIGGVILGMGLCVYLLVQAVGNVISGPPPIAFDQLTGVVQVSTPAQPNSIAWSPDGAFIAGGTWDSPPFTGTIGSSGDVYVVDVAQAKVLPTLKQKTWVRGVAFSPDGKWLAVATAYLAIGAKPAELVVYDVPAFTPRFQGKAEGPGGFVDLAWAADNRTLWALDSFGDAMQKAVVRSWAVPEFEERPAIRTPQAYQFEAIAVSPDGKTLAVADKTDIGGARLVRLFDTETGQERSSFEAKSSQTLAPRLAFTPDGKSVAVDEISSGLTWWDAATGRPAEPEPARFAATLPGLSHRESQHALSPDGTRSVESYKKQPRAMFEGLGGPPNQFGIFVKLTDLASAKTWTWRLGDTFGSEPAVAFSPDGKKLAATVGNPSGGTVVIWDVPK